MKITRQVLEYLFQCYICLLCTYPLTSRTSLMWDNDFSQVCTALKKGPTNLEADMPCSCIALSSRVCSTSSTAPRTKPRSEVPLVYLDTENLMFAQVSSISLTPCGTKQNSTCLLNQIYLDFGGTHDQFVGYGRDNLFNISTTLIQMVILCHKHISQSLLLFESSI